MKLKIKNFGLIEEADIDIGKITLIAGNNATGKSTTSKLLYSIIHSKSKSADEFVNRDYEKFLTNKIGKIEKLLINNFNKFENYFFLVEKLNKIKLEKNKIEELNKIKDLISENKEIELEIKDEILGELETIEKVMTQKIDDYEILKRVMKLTMENEFDNQLLTNFDKGNFKYESGKHGIYLAMNIDSENQISPIEIDINANYLNNFNIDEVYYLETPFILEFSEMISNRTNFDHYSLLLNKLMQPPKEKSIFEQEINKKYLKIENKINQIIKGQLYYDNQARGFLFKENARVFNVSNIASGIKSISIIQMILGKMELDRYSYLIMDEPEVHLHPEWQLKLAEIIVMLAKELGVHIYINSHSPYFIEAIEVYSKFYKLEEVNYYLTKKGQNSKFKIERITEEHMEEMYRHLATPYDTINEIHNSIYQEELSDDRLFPTK